MKSTFQRAKCSLWPGILLRHANKEDIKKRLVARQAVDDEHASYAFLSFSISKCYQSSH